MAKSIKVKIRGDATSFNRALKQSEQGMSRFAKAGQMATAGLKAGFTAAAAAAAALAAAIGGSMALAGKGADQVSKITDIAGNIGISAGAVVRFQQVLRDAGLQADDLGTVFAKMQKSIIEAPEQAGLARAFQRIGLDVKKLMDLSPEEQFLAIGKAIGSLKDPATKTAAAMEIFGRSGAKLVNAFAGGRDPTEHLYKSTTRLAKFVDEYGQKLDKLADMRASIRPGDEFTKGFAGGMADAMIGFYGAMDQIDWVGLGKTIGEFAGQLITAMGPLIDAFSDIVIAVTDVGFGLQQAALFFSLGFSKIMQDIASALHLDSIAKWFQPSIDAALEELNQLKAERQKSKDEQAKAKSDRKTAAEQARTGAGAAVTQHPLGVSSLAAIGGAAVGGSLLANIVSPMVNQQKLTNSALNKTNRRLTSIDRHIQLKQPAVFA